MVKTILVTGGTGFIGSHTCVELIAHGYQVLILDNLSNSQKSVLDAIEKITGTQAGFIEGDIRDRTLLDTIFQQHKIAAVIHFAGLKAVGESVAQPLKYYDNNITGTLTLLQAMQQAHVRNLVFSSSATVYGDPQQLPIPETHPLSATNTYGHTKLVLEQALSNLYQSEGGWRIALLRY